MKTTPKNFTEADIPKDHASYPRIFTIDTELLYAPLEWQKRGLQQTASGYGAKLTTSKKIQFEGKFYRIYCTCYGNSGSCWFTVKGRKIYVH